MDKNCLKQHVLENLDDILIQKLRSSSNITGYQFERKVDFQAMRRAELSMDSTA
jgi:hypothetical protein